MRGGRAGARAETAGRPRLTRRGWLGAQRFERAAQQLTFETYLHALDLVDRRIEVLEREIAALAAAEPWRELVGRLRCLRGIDTLTALAIAVEVGDFERFETAEEFMPTWTSSPPSAPPARAAGRGRSPRRATRICAACSSRRPGTSALARRWALRSPAASAARTRLRSSAPWRAQQLHRRWRRMQGRGKPRQKIVVAVARELSGFVWATATDQPLGRT